MEVYGRLIFTAPVADEYAANISFRTAFRALGTALLCSAASAARQDIQSTPC